MSLDAEQQLFALLGNSVASQIHTNRTARSSYGRTNTKTQLGAGLPGSGSGLTSILGVGSHEYKRLLCGAA
eukprot:5836136-Amphidinium_carterae.1